MATAFKRLSQGVPEFFGRLFQARDYIHLAHLKINGSGSYAFHKATDEFYGGILDLTDSLIESYQGIKGLVTITIPSSQSNTNAVSFLEELYSYIDSNRSIFTESFLQNQVDEIQQLIASTLYKLKNLH